ncbi:hypothetical protein JOQ06_000037 [Pogonophryne albipinna]|uniref:Uncharacterized protein n=1 Tax=Pogonophryne albipinna TaxID=1090488 RepID=A0AAD6A8W4_9TELE|nr:hypothetical protein JOQ06_000037 [Pogonophryne albipinna]
MYGLDTSFRVEDGGEIFPESLRANDKAANDKAANDKAANGVKTAAGEKYLLRRLNFSTFLIWMLGGK